jgi:hypothetical protein
MGLGNGNPNEGDKGSNFNYELKTLQLLQAIAVAVEGGGGGGGLTCTTVEDCTIIESIKTSVQDFGTQLATIEAACFVPSITSTVGATVTNRSGQYQRVGNIVTCTVYFTIGATSAVDDQIDIEVPIQDPASDYTAANGLIMGSLTSTGIETWRNLDFAGGTTNGLSFFIRTTAPITIQNKYVAQFSYAYHTSLC